MPHLDFTLEKNPLSANEEGSSPSKRSLPKQFGPTGELNACISFLLFCSQLYITYISIFGRPFLNPFADYSNDNSTVPALSSSEYSTSVLSILLIVSLGIISGFIIQFARLPALLGMLLVGIALRNIPWTGSVMFVTKDWGIVLRKTAFIVILLRGGLSLDAAALRKMKGACIRLAFLPCSMESVAVAIAAKILFGFDLLFGLLLGSVLAAVSPAVVVPSMLEAAKDGYGIAKGIPSLVVAAASLDDVYAITLFSILLTVIFSTGSGILMTVIRAPIEVISGTFFGGIVGLILRYFPSRDQKNVHLIRLSLLISFSTSLLFGTASLGVDSIGAIAVLVAAFVAGHAWKEEGPMPEEESLSIAWHLFFQPALFGLIGFVLSFNLLTPSAVGFGLLVLLFGVVVRIATSSVAVLGCSLSFKERLFVAIAWLPKATVQAALAPVALDLCSSRGDLPPEYNEWSVLILTVAVLSILTTAPIGAFLIRLTYPRLLTKNNREEDLVM